MLKKNINYVFIDKEGNKSYLISHNSVIVPRVGETIKDELGTHIVKDVIHENLFVDPDEHTVTVVFETT